MKRLANGSAVVLAVITLLVVACGPETLKDIIEDKFEDFTGLETALKRSYIVGLQPAPGFPNLHCCWVGDKTGWEKIAGSWSTRDKTEVDAGVTGIIQSIGFEIDAKSTSFVEAKAEPFYRQQLLEIRHFSLPHCPGHNKGSCAREICTDSLKVGKVSVTSYVEWEGGVGVSADKVGKVKIGNKQYTKDTMEARDIIVGYKMEEVSCGPDGVWFGDSKSPSAAHREGETYQGHVKLRQWVTGQIGTTIPIPNRPPSTDPKVVTPPDQASGVITPPAGGVIQGQVIRVSTTNESGRPVQAISGVVVSETDEAGNTTTSEVATDADGGAWIFVPAATALLTISHGGDEVLRTVPGPDAGIPEVPPSIETVDPYVGEAPPGIVESGSLVEIEGQDFATVSQVEINGEPVNVVATGGDWAVIEFDAVGPATVEVGTAFGLESAPIEVEGVSITVEQAPPATMTAGQSSVVILRITGTERVLPINFVADSTVVTLSGGASTMTVSSTGGADNTVRMPVTAIQNGAYTINYNLVGEEP